ncbi:class I SAM-dependent DNA methyltransferase [Methylobacterium sp. J-068]|uniref:class I SAM-dependent DNA methyltransferase n=1 Tax=Methylobacterium sp. J-068 TaxID=2836649 RepID=UPI001FBA56E1|nr:class I SAM-dependent DNA methyltransferase [Methylobacterium sp. J-068]MCJ2032634.1 type I restriction-modification system subunit M [Methylobacterium sp. J-068]
MTRGRKPSATPKTTAQRLDAIVKSARTIMRKDKGLNGDLDRLPMLTWVMFLKFLDDMERIEADEAVMEGRAFQPAIEPPYRWRDWAAAPDGITGPDLLSFVTAEEAIRLDGTKGPGLFAYLRGLRGRSGVRDRRDVVSTVFRGLQNRMESGYLLRDVVNLVHAIHFDASDEIHTLSRLYEGLLREMRDAAGDSGEFYTPRPVVRLMVELIDPRLGETVLDPACGTGGFLAEAFDHLSAQANTVAKRKQVQRGSLRGGEAKSLPYLLAQMNLLLHGLEAPVIDPGNALRFRLAEIGEADRVDVILTNPPFGGEEEAGILTNFPDDRRTAETALLFLQVIMRRLRRGGRGRAAVVVPNGILFGDGIAARVKGDLLANFNLHTIVRLPEGVFAPYTDIPTNILFFNSSGPTENIWYWQQPLPKDRRKYTKTMPLQTEDFTDLRSWWHDPQPGPNAWCVPAADIIRREETGRVIDANLDLKNPQTCDTIDHRAPAEIVASAISRQFEALAILQELRTLVAAGSEGDAV